MRDREQAIKAVTRAIFEPRPYWETEPPEAYEVAEKIIDAYEALPVVVSDEIVERAVEAYWLSTKHNTSRTFKDDMRAALEAALGKHD